MAFRIAHCADWHLGYRSGKKTDENGVNLRLLDGFRALEKVVDGIIAEKVDCVLVAGDVFHSPFPQPIEIVFAQEQLRRFAEASIPVYQLAGNHEATDVAADVASSKILDDPWRKIYSHVEPYAVHEIADGLILHLVSRHQFKRQKGTLDAIRPVDGAVNLFSSHGSVLDPETNLMLSTPQSPREIVIPEQLLHQWDYLLLGHIHERKKVSDKIFYNGSLLRRGFSDKECELKRGWTLVSVETDGTVTLEPQVVEERPQFDLPSVDASGLTADDVSDKIIAALKSTQTDGVSFDPLKAPLVRQKIVNAPASLLAGLKNDEFIRQSAHTFSWQLQVTPTVEGRTHAGDGDGSTVKSELTLKEAYMEWSDALEPVKAEASSFLDKGVEKWAASEH